MLARKIAGIDKVRVDSGGLKSAQWVIAPFNSPPGPYFLLIAATVLEAAAAADAGVGTRRCLIWSGMVAKKWPWFQRINNLLTISSLLRGKHASPVFLRSDVHRHMSKLWT